MPFTVQAVGYYCNYITSEQISLHLKRILTELPDATEMRFKMHNLDRSKCTAVITYAVDQN